MRADVERGLTATYGADQFKIADLKRRGSAGQHRASWRNPARGLLRRGAAAGPRRHARRLGQARRRLAGDVAGRGPRISGVKSSGNQAGDRIIAHASAIYRKDGDAWTLVTPAGFKAAEAPTLDSGTPPTVTRQLLDTLDQITHSVAYSASSTAQHVVQQELERSVSRINGRLSRLQHGYPLAGGPDRGEYVAFARALAGASRSQQIRITRSSPAAARKTSRCCAPAT